MCSRAPPASATWPEVSSTKHSLSACLCASMRERGREIEMENHYQLEQIWVPITRMISFCTLGSWVLMLASPTWPSSYLHVPKNDPTLVIFFLIKRHHSHLYLHAPLSAVPVSEGNQLQRLLRQNPMILFLVFIPSREKKKSTQLKRRTGALV